MANKKDKFMSIRKIIRAFQNDFNHESSKATITETVKFKIVTDKSEDLSRFLNVEDGIDDEAIKQSTEALDRLLNDFTNMRTGCLEELYNRYKENEFLPIFDVQTYLQDKAIHQDNTENKYLLSARVDSWEKVLKNKSSIKSFFKCPECKNNLELFSFSTHYFSSCELHPEYFILYGSHGQTNFEELEFIEDKLKIVLPTQQDMSNFYATKFITERVGKYSSPLYTKGLKPLKEVAQFNWSSIVGATLRVSIAKDISSFYVRFTDSLAENLKTFREINKNLKTLKELIKENSIDCKHITTKELKFPEQYNRLSINEFNSEIKKINQYINEILWQKYKLDKEKAKKLKTLKGTPSFPIIELYSSEQKDKNLLIDDLVKKIDLLKPKFNKVDAKTKKDVINWWIDRFYSEKLNDKVKNPNQSLAKFFSYCISSGIVTDFECLSSSALKFLELKIKKLKDHWEKVPSDILAFQKLNTWMRTLSTYLLWHIKSNTDEFIKLSSEINEIYGHLRGISRKDNSKEYEIPGFSLSKHIPQYGGLLAFKEYNDKSKSDRKFYLALSLEQSNENKLNRIKLVKVQGKSMWKGLTTVNGQLTVKDFAINPKEKNMIFLPLKLGKRQGRKYLWNYDFSPFNSKHGNTMNLKLANGRVICEEENDQKNYYFAITYQFEYPKSGLSDYQYQSIIGLDRGENTPLVAALTDLNGNLINKIELKGVKKEEEQKNPLSLYKIYKSKQKNIQDEKEKQQRELGTYSNKLAKKQKNISEDMINNVAKVLLNLLYQYNGILVLEDLTRGFGLSGRGTYAFTKQYTKLEDTLLEKLFSSLAFGKKPLTSKYIKRYSDKCKIIGKVTASYTSITCSKCGRIYTKDREAVSNSLDISNNEISFTLKHNGQEKKFFVSPEIKNLHFLLKEGDSHLTNRYEVFTKNTLIRFVEIINKKKDKSLTKTDRETLSGIICKFIVKPRKEQYEEFHCIWCGHLTNADEQAALNIARKWLFKDSQEFKLYRKSKDTGNKESELKYWQEFYLRKIKEGSWTPSPELKKNICLSVT